MPGVSSMYLNETTTSLDLFKVFKEDTKIKNENHDFGGPFLFISTAKIGTENFQLNM